jgi:hypothetical protein
MTTDAEINALLDRFETLMTQEADRRRLFVLLRAALVLDSTLTDSRREPLRAVATARRLVLEALPESL